MRVEWLHKNENVKQNANLQSHPTFEYAPLADPGRLKRNDVQTVHETGIFEAARTAAASLETCNNDTELSQHVPPPALILSIPRELLCKATRVKRGLVY